MSGDTVNISAVESAGSWCGVSESPLGCRGTPDRLSDQPDSGGSLPPPPRSVPEPPPLRASTAPRVPPPVDPYLERQMQQQLTSLADVVPPEPEQREDGFVLFHAMPGGLVSAVVHLVLFLLLSLYVAGDSDRGAKLVSLFVIDSDDDAQAEAFEELILDMPPVVADEPLEADQAFWDDVVLTAPEIAPPELDVPTFEPAALEPDLGTLVPKLKPARNPGFTVGGDASGGLALRGDRRQQALTRGATVESENAVQLALQWLVRHQRSDGSWCFNQQQGDHHCAGCRCSAPGPFADALNGATGMVLLALLGAGHTHLQGEYRAEVSAGLRYLIQRQASDGGLRDPSGNMYSHGLAALALCEALAMTRDIDVPAATATPRWGEPGAVADHLAGAAPNRGGRSARSGHGNLLDFDLYTPVPVTIPELTDAAQQSIKFIEWAQHSAGGWRYRPNQPGDTSVVGWQLMTLKSAYLGGLEVDPKVAARATRFLDFVSEDRVGSAYGYTRGNQLPYLDKNARITATTPIGLLCRMYTGWQRGRPGLSHGVERLNFWARPGMGLYHYYYATQVMHHYGGPQWEKWNAFMRDYLVQTQSREGSELGSWMLDGHHDNAGRLYCTALAAMTLEVYYRYSPIYGKASVTASTGTTGSR